MTATTVDPRREYPALYRCPSRPVLIDVPELAYLMIDGHGDPNTSPAYAEAVQALYSVAYAVRFALKRNEGIEVKVAPLEGLWWAADPASFHNGKKVDWDWTMMILQPEELTAERLADVIAAVRDKPGAAAAVTRLRLERFAEGCCAQVLHIGPYADEGPTIERLHAFIADHGLQLAGKHHEVYLGDPRRAAPERLRTIIRQPVA